MDKQTENNKEYQEIKPISNRFAFKLRKKHIVPFLVVLIAVLFTIPTTLLLTKQNQSYQSKASNPSPSVIPASLLQAQESDLGNSVQFIVADPNEMTRLRNQPQTQNVQRPGTSCDMFPGLGECNPISTQSASINSNISNITSNTPDVHICPNHMPCGPLTYHGGPIIHTPKILLVEWGPKWEHVDNYIKSIHHYLASLNNEYTVRKDTWVTTTDQYGDHTGAAAFYKSPVKIVIDPSTPHRPTGNDISNEALAMAQKYVNPGDYPNTIVAVAIQQGACPVDFPEEGCPKPNKKHVYCAWHNVWIWNSPSNDLPFINIPWQRDGHGYGWECLGGWSTAFGHEYAESITDPVENAWYNKRYGEIGDECDFIDKNLPFEFGTFTEQSLYSNAENGCTFASGIQYEIKDSYGTCLEDQSGSVADHNPIVTRACNDSPPQRITYYPDNTLRVLGRCIKEVYGPYSHVYLSECFGGPDEKWIYTSSKQLMKKDTNLCLAEPNKRGDQLVVKPCHKNDKQEEWYLPK